ncbi:hypothetical protein NDU88_005884 [Pleurodeles waltl]|uniref:Uncharacterized protein n=1 Tax=Pleurodeles waltl TaxID=8319 RepID=A0AAV7TWN4_PLEWA|nr:hypothetical protein NDU88_005884 [Pleurodeles waltl]
MKAYLRSLGIQALRWRAAGGGRMGRGQAHCGLEASPAKRLLCTSCPRFFPQSGIWPSARGRGLEVGSSAAQMLFCAPCPRVGFGIWEQGIGAGIGSGTAARSCRKEQQMKLRGGCATVATVPGAR